MSLTTIGNFTTSDSEYGYFSNLASSNQNKGSSFLNQLSSKVDGCADCSEAEVETDSVTISDEAEAAAANIATEEEDESSAVVETESDSLEDSFALRDAILEKMGLSEEDIQSISSGKVMVELNISIVQSITTSTGTTTRSMSFSYTGSLEYLQSYYGAGGAGQTDSATSLSEYFSPEATAERILDFALSFFEMSDAYQEMGDTEEARQAFADYIGEAIQKGFDQAMDILGNLSEYAQDTVDQTHELVFQGLEDFVSGASDDDAVVSIESSDESDNSWQIDATLTASYSMSRSWSQLSIQSTYSFSLSYSYSSTNSDSSALDATDTGLLETTSVVDDADEVSEDMESEESTAGASDPAQIEMGKRIYLPSEAESSETVEAIA